MIELACSFCDPNIAGRAVTNWSPQLRFRRHNGEQKANRQITTYRKDQGTVHAKKCTYRMSSIAPSSQNCDGNSVMRFDCCVKHTGFWNNHGYFCFVSNCHWCEVLCFSNCICLICVKWHCFPIWRTLYLDISQRS